MKRPIRIEGDIAYVPLTRGYVAVIDAADAPLVDGVNWAAQVTRHTVYAKRKVRAADGGEATLSLHRAIMGDSQLLVDHADGDGLNNRRANLRFATISENMRNRRMPRSNTSGLKGASWSSKYRRWMAQIRFAGRVLYLGYHNTAADAHAAYCAASEQLHGAFGRTK